MALVLVFSSFSQAQDVFVGLTSNGGPEGKGTAFTIKPTGNDYTIIKGFAEWGITPNGDLYKNNDGNFYGMNLWEIRDTIKINFSPA
ncbi:MAG: choice-of-anchor tandem repeat GloVer-containing protein [Chitinophagales bacterium]